MYKCEGYFQFLRKSELSLLYVTDVFIRLNCGSLKACLGIILLRKFAICTVMILDAMAIPCENLRLKNAGHNSEA